ncbi:MAG: alanine racemase, partial [Nitriliruptoraceae bacterium]
EVCAVVKADGYGHGAVTAATAALAGGARWLAVALVEEGQALRAAGIDADVLLLSEPSVDAIDALLDAHLTPMVYTRDFVAALAGAARSRGITVGAHLKVDTGMGRVGVPAAEWEECLDWFADESVTIDGIATHLARADELDAPTTAEQHARFESFLDRAADFGIRPRWVHAANTAAALCHPAVHYDLVRVGIGIYGLSPSADVDAAAHGLRPALRVVSHITYAKRVTAGTPASYGHRWSAPADGWLATVPIGYADGVPRALTNRATAMLGGVRRPIVGTVCMDQLLVWCGDAAVTVGEPVVLLGDGVRVEDWAVAADTITYEIVTQLTARLPRVEVTS